MVARDTPEQHPWVSREEVAMIASGRGDVKREAALAEAERKAGVPWMRIFSSKEVLALMASYFTFGYISWLFFSWFYIYLAQVRGELQMVAEACQTRIRARRADQVLTRTLKLR